MKRIALYLLIVMTAAAAETPQELHQKALVKERSEGNLEEAIQLYRRAADSAGKDRALAAKALIRMAECQRALGAPAARSTYERLVRDFADQKEVAAHARARLIVIDGLPPGGLQSLSTRRLWIGTGGAADTGSPSADGSYLSFTDWSTGDVAIRDLVSGGTRRLTRRNPATDRGRFAFSSRISPDGKQVAFSWNTRTSYELRVVSADGSKQRVLVANPDIAYLDPADWSPDGKRILAHLSRRDGTSQIAFVSVGDGAVTVLKSLPWTGIVRMALSPDGQYVAYDLQARNDSATRKVLALAADGSRELPITEHPGLEELFGWSPDGKWLVFASRRSGKRELWAVPMAHGKTLSAARVVKRDLGDATPIGFDKKGTLYYSIRNANTEVFLAEVDWQTGAVSPETPVTSRFVGTNHSAGFSPDGRFLAFLSQRSPDAAAHSLVVRSMSTGEERDIKTDIGILPGLLPLQWFEDGNSLLARARDTQNRFGVFAIDVATGVGKTLIADTAPFSVNSLMPLRDGRSIVYWHTDRKVRPPVSRVLVRDVTSGVERELLPGSAHVAPGGNGRGIVLSRDGKLLAFGTSEPARAVIKTVPVAGGPATELFAASDPGTQLIVRGWTPDSMHVIFSVRDPTQASTDRTGKQTTTSTVWFARVAGGAAKRLDGLGAIEYLAVHPNGRLIVFSHGESLTEIWAMENLQRALGNAR